MPPQPDRQPLLPRLPGWLATVGLVALAAVRCIVTFSPRVYWETDPRAGQAMSTAFGPAGAAVTDWLCVAVLALAVLDALLHGRRTRPILIGLWAVGLGFVLYQGARDIESLRVGGHWVGALALGLAAAHLAADRLQRRVILAAAVALLIPLGLQAVYQVAVGHPATVENYEQNREQIAQQRGWEPGSVEQRKFEERMYQVEATGRFGFSNVLGSVVMTLTLIALGVGVGLRGAAGVGISRGGEGIAKPRAAVVGGIALLGLGTLGLTFSKGAAVALVVSAAAAGGAWWIARWRKWGSGWWRAVAFGVVAMGLAAVLARGAMGPPETAAGERSLLFRYHYWQASASMLAERPIAGVGPGRFQQAYLVHKNPLNPEDVADPHSVFAAYLSTLGLGGLAWSALVLAMLWGAGGGVREPAAGEREAASGGEREAVPRWSMAAAAGVLAFGAAYLVELTLLGLIAAAVAGLAGVLILVARQAARTGNPAAGGVVTAAALVGTIILLPPVGLWLAGGLGFVAVTGWLSGRAELDGPAARVGLFAAAVALLLHGQISLSLTNPMAAPLLFVVLGVAGRGWGFLNFDFRFLIWVALVIVVIALGVMGVMHTAPIVGHQAALRAAERAVRTGPPGAAIGHLADARRSYQDGRVGVYEARLWVEQAAAAHQRGDANRRDEYFSRAMGVLEEARETGSDLARLWRDEAILSERAAEMTGDARWLTRAADAAEHALRYNPYDASAHVLAADLARRTGRTERARAWYERAVELNDLAYLDPNRQWTEAERDSIRRKLEMMNGG